MLVRGLSAVVGIGLFLACCFAGLAPFVVAVTALAAIGASEFTAGEEKGLQAKPVAAAWEGRAARFSRLNPILVSAGTFLPLLVLALAQNGSHLLTPFAFERGLVVLICSGLVVRFARTGKALGDFRACYGLFGFYYVGALFASFVLLRSLPGSIRVGPFGLADRGAWVMLFVAVCVWATDTFAYGVGRAVGRHKLAPALSPGKTLEGALGGLVGALVVGMLFARWIHLPMSVGLVVGAIAGIAGQLGDLFESALKREIGVKDFGRVLPGHGGALDRFDSLLFVAPLAYLYLHFVVGI